MKSNSYLNFSRFVGGNDTSSCNTSDDLIRVPRPSSERDLVYLGVDDDTRWIGVVVRWVGVPVLTGISLPFADGPVNVHKQWICE